MAYDDKALRKEMDSQADRVTFLRRIARVWGVLYRFSVAVALGCAAAGVFQLVGPAAALIGVATAGAMALVSRFEAESSLTEADMWQRRFEVRNVVSEFGIGPNANQLPEYGYSPEQNAYLANGQENFASQDQQYSEEAVTDREEPPRADGKSWGRATRESQEAAAQASQHR